jgi:hypothetical protein
VANAEFEDVLLFLNHSCEPNVGIQGQIVVVAMRDIAAGEELTIDYALIDHDAGPMAGRCGAEGCRQLITGRDGQKPELQPKGCRSASCSTWSRSARQPGQSRVGARLLHGVQPLIGQVANARHEAEAAQVAQGEHVVSEPRRVSVVRFEAQVGFVVQQPSKVANFPERAPARESGRS